MKTIVVTDGQGGRIGAQLVKGIKTQGGARVLAIGTNSTATAAMIRAGADEAATGENALIVACRHADIIVGPVGIVIADALLGEITPAMAAAVGQSDAVKLLIPFSHCKNVIVGVEDYSTGKLIEKTLTELGNLLEPNPPRALI